MGISVQRGGFVTVGSLMVDVIDIMRSNGFTVVSPESYTPPVGAAQSAFAVTMEASGTVDPLNKAEVAIKQPWRVKFQVLNDQTCTAFVATPLQLRDDGTHSFITNEQGTPQDALGAVGAAWSQGSLRSDDPSQGFINRVKRVGAQEASYPLSYLLTITDRGFYLGIWEDSVTAQYGTFFNWMLVQRPVFRENGQTVVTGKCPIFCVNSVNNRYWRFTVRESDVIRPSLRAQADADTPDYESILNSTEQVALTEDNRYVVTFPARLNTARYRYTYELDMIGITSADVISQELDVPVTVYGEARPRVYKALHANGLNNTGMRVLALTNGGGANPLA